MATKWMTPPKLAKLLNDYFPTSATQVRNWCEEGLIPPECARKTPSLKDRGQWRIAADRLDSFFSNVLGIPAQDIASIYVRLDTLKTEK